MPTLSYVIDQSHVQGAQHFHSRFTTGNEAARICMSKHGNYLQCPVTF